MTLVAQLAGVGSPARAADGDLEILALRELVVLDLVDGGPSVRRAAEAALVGSDADLRAYDDERYEAAQEADERAAAQVLAGMDGGSLRAAAERALAGSRADVQAFIAGGWEGAFSADERVRAYRVLEAGGPTARAAAQKALNGSAEDLNQFLTSGREAAAYADDRLAATSMLAGAANNSGPVLDAAAQQALSGTAQQLRDFLTWGQYTARARDKELAQVRALTEQARVAGQNTAREALAAQEASDRAEAAAGQAKAAAQTANAEAKAAGKDAAKASAAAGRAADAAEGAAAAARQAIAASNAAMRAARVAADAARRAQSAASLTAQAAARARRAASAAHLNAGDARLAREAAEAARDAAARAKELALVKAESDRAQAQARAASAAAKRASGNAAAAGVAADEAGRQSGVSASQAARARNAAAQAAAAAATADRAADRAESLAAQAAQASQEAFAFAARAAEHAEKAAQAAVAAAEAAEAGRKSAALAVEHAKAAVESANLAVQAAGDADAVEKLARQQDVDRRTQWTEQGVRAAQEALAAEQAVKAAGGEAAAWNRSLGWDTAEQDRIDAATRAMLNEAGAVGASSTVVLDSGRRAALALTTFGGDWSKAAAQEALAGDETAMRSWLAEGRRLAAGQDDRARVWRLVDTLPDGAEKTAAQAALNGDDAAVEAFLRTRAYPGKVAKDRQQVYRILETAGPTVKGAAERALAGTAADLHQFLRSGQYVARTADERLEVYRAMESGGPEVDAAAEVALAGPPSYISYFLTVSRYEAAQRDAEQEAHVQAVRALVGQAQQHANTALKDADKAAEAALDAQGFAKEADAYAAAAVTAANTAEKHRQNAVASANAAQQSAERAAQSATTARNASNSAQASASRAAESAATATAASRRAQADATTAYEAAARARADAKAAGKDAAAANQAAKEAKAIYATKLKEWEAQQRSTAPGSGANGTGTAADDNKNWGCLALNASAVSRECLTVYKQFTEALINPAKCGAPANAGTASCTMLGELKGFVEENPDLLVDMLQFTLMACGLVPGAGEVCDGIDAAISFGRKDYLGGFLSLGAMIPVLGAGATALKAFKSSDKLRNIKNIVEKLFTGCRNASSFVPGTRVLVGPGGRSEKIEDLTARQHVVSTSVGLGRTDKKAVTAVRSSIGMKKIVDITVDTDGDAGTKTATISATTNHPFWVPALRSWVPAGALLSGLSLRSPRGGPVQVVATAVRTETIRVHNLAIADYETYYVLAGNTPVLVHNCGKAIYEAGGKHGPTARNTSRGPNSAEPKNGQGAYENSIEWTPEGPGQAPRRIGVSDGEIVILDRTRQVPCGCSTDGGMNDIWHGHVRSWDELSPGMKSAAIKAGLVDRKGRPKG